MFSNLPTMLQQQDFQASNRDMLEAARGGVTVADPKHARQMQKIKDQFLDNLSEMAAILERKLAEGMFAAATDTKFSGICGGENRMLGELMPDAKIGTQLRVRLPANYSVLDGPELTLPESIDPDRYKTISVREITEYRPCSESLIPPPSSRD